MSSLEDKRSSPRVNIDKIGMLPHDTAWMAQKFTISSKEQFDQFADQERRFYHAFAHLPEDKTSQLAAVLIADAMQESRRYYNPPAEHDQTLLWTQSIMRILSNRKADAHTAATALGNREFTDSLFQDIQSKKLNPKEEVPPLTPDKIRELLDIVLVPRSDGRVEPAPHIHFSALGHWLGHQALAAAFHEQAKGLAVMRQVMKEALPDMPAANVDLFCGHWMKVRQVRAQQVAAESLPTSQVTQQAVQYSEGLKAEQKPEKPVARPETNGVHMVISAGPGLRVEIDTPAAQTGR